MVFNQSERAKFSVYILISIQTNVAVAKHNLQLNSFLVDSLNVRKFS